MKTQKNYACNDNSKRRRINSAETIYGYDNGKTYDPRKNLNVYLKWIHASLNSKTNHNDIHRPITNTSVTSGLQNAKVEGL